MDREKLIREKALREGRDEKFIQRALAADKNNSAQKISARSSNAKNSPSIVRGAEAITSLLGGGKLVDFLGSKIAKATAPKELRGTIDDQTSGREALGSAALVGANLVPVGAGASALIRGGGLAARAGRAALQGAAGGGAAGAASEVADDEFNLSELARKGAAGAVRGGTIGAAIPGAGALGGRVRSVLADSVFPTAKAIGKGVGTRLGRGVGRIRDARADAVEQQIRIDASSPAVRTAIRAEVDDKVLGAVQQADVQTLRGYRSIVDIAEENVGKIKVEKRPELIAGRAAADQYQTIVDQRRNIGRQIGEASRRLSESGRPGVNVPVGRIENDILGSQGITVGEKGKLVFTNTKFTKPQRTRIQDMYDLATEGSGGDFSVGLTPVQLRNKDQLFSALQRESRFEGIGDIIIELPDGTQSNMFSAFRNVFSDSLEEIAPEIRDLNRQYRTITQVVEDIENSIIKGGNFNINEKADPAGFAKTGLRRIFSNSQSANSYGEIAEQMDELSRALGYSGARPDDLAAFAIEIQRLYPDSVPKTSLEGVGQRTILGTLEQVAQTGKAGVEDQREAIKKVLEELLRD